jgi:8-oxo-dGTP pyrophosphatase MutT (NUDIX family)
MPDPHRARLAAQFDDYFLHWPEEKAAAAGFSELLGQGDPFVRTRLEGHFTASAWLVSADGARVLLMHHAKLLRWLQPGGHADGEADLPRVALKEAEEETGLTGLVVEDGAIFDLDRHWIPGRRDVPGHWHFDVRYVVRAAAGEVFVGNHESLGLAWRAADQLLHDPDASLSRMAGKWLKRMERAAACL